MKADKNTPDDTKNNKFKLDRNVLLMVVFALIIIGVIVLIIQVIQKGLGAGLSANDTILLFVGLLATFIVLNNINQVYEIRNDVNDKIKNLRLEIENLKTDYKYLLNIKMLDIPTNINIDSFERIRKYLKEATKDNPKKIFAASVELEEKKDKIIYYEYEVVKCVCIRNRRVILEYKKGVSTATMTLDHLFFIAIEEDLQIICVTDTIALDKYICMKN